MVGNKKCCKWRIVLRFKSNSSDSFFFSYFFNIYMNSLSRAERSSNSIKLSNFEFSREITRHVILSQPEILKKKDVTIKIIVFTSFWKALRKLLVINLYISLNNNISPTFTTFEKNCSICGSDARLVNQKKT